MSLYKVNGVPLYTRRPWWHGTGPYILLFITVIVLGIAINQSLKNDFKSILGVQRAEIESLEREVEDLRHQQEILEDALQRRIQQVHDLLYRLDAIEDFHGVTSETSLLERLVMAEAAGEGYKGMLAVANVVLNRVSDARFPGTIQEVIKQPGQFCPVGSGAIYYVSPCDTAKRAVADAVEGHRVVSEKALFFYNPAVVSRGHWIRSRVTVADIGNHRFAQ